MPEGNKRKTKPVVLVKWRFAQDKHGSAGEARYWWSDGSRTKEKMSSYLAAISRLKGVQDDGGEKAAEKAHASGPSA